MLAFHPTLMARNALANALMIDDALSAGTFPFSHSQLARCGMSAMASFAHHAPSFSVTEMEDHFLVTVEAPGTSAKGMDVVLEHDILTVSASRDGFSFKRQFTLPNAEASSATAKYQEGILTIKLNKVAPAEPVTIAVLETDADTHDKENAKNFTLSVAAPGVKAKDIIIVASQDELSIRGETTSGSRGTFRVDRKYKLPRSADATAATASHIDGLLTIELPVLARAITSIEISTFEETDVKTDVKADDGAASQQSAPEPPAETVGTAESESKQNEPEEPWLAEWDTMLDDLAEMGFEDRESSREVLAKHAGSLKLAVKELVSRRAAK